MKIDLTQDVLGVTEFRSVMSETIERVEEKKQPVVLTKGGRPSVVILDVESYQHMVWALENSGEEKLRERILKAEADVKEGKVKSHSDAMAEFKQRRKARKNGKDL